MPVDPKDIARKPDGSGQLAARPPGSGTQKGGYKKLTLRMKEAFARYAEEHGERANPLICLCDIMRDEKTEPHVRVAAASKLAQFLIPKKFELETEETDDSKIAFYRRFTATIMGTLPSGEGASVVPLLEATDARPE